MPKLKIEKMFVFVAEGEEGEGVIGAGTEKGVMPLVGADMNMVKSLIPVADRITAITGVKYRILEFSCRKDITDQFHSSATSVLH